MIYEIDFAICISSEANIEHKKSVNVNLFFSNGNAEFEILRLLREEKKKNQKTFSSKYFKLKWCQNQPPGCFTDTTDASSLNLRITVKREGHDHNTRHILHKANISELSSSTEQTVDEIFLCHLISKI